MTPVEPTDGSTETDATTTVTPATDAGTTPVTPYGRRRQQHGRGPLQKVTQTNLFADTVEGGAPNVDPNLVNPWGLAFNPAGIAWISDNGTGLATLYKTNTSTPVALVVQVPLPDGGGGAIYNALDSGTSRRPRGKYSTPAPPCPTPGPRATSWATSSSSRPKTARSPAGHPRWPTRPRRPFASTCRPRTPSSRAWRSSRRRPRCSSRPTSTTG